MKTILNFHELFALRDASLKALLAWFSMNLMCLSVEEFNLLHVSSDQSFKSLRFDSLNWAKILFLLYYFIVIISLELLLTETSSAFTIAWDCMEQSSLKIRCVVCCGMRDFKNLITNNILMTFMVSLAKSWFLWEIHWVGGGLKFCVIHEQQSSL